jgi:predicted Zn-dependent peptidase
VYYVQKDIPQGRVLIGHPGLKRRSWEDPDEFALMVMNDILGGGGFTSRMVKRIRSDEGLAYSAGSQFGIGTWWPGIFQVSFQSKSATVPLASKIALDEIERMKAEKVGAEELTVSKNSFIDVFPRRFESAEDIVDTFVSDEYEGRPHTYWKTYRDRVRAVTADDVQRVAREYLHPDRLVFLVVGNWEAVRAGDADGRATMAQFHQGNAVELPLRDPLTLQPIR